MGDSRSLDLVTVCFLDKVSFRPVSLFSGRLLVSSVFGASGSSSSIFKDEAVLFLSANPPVCFTFWSVSFDSSAKSALQLSLLPSRITEPIVENAFEDAPLADADNFCGRDFVEEAGGEVATSFFALSTSAASIDTRCSNK